MTPTKRAVGLLGFTLFFMSLVSPAEAASGTRFIVRVNGGLPAITAICESLGCTVEHDLGDPLGAAFLITTKKNVVPNTFFSKLRLQVAVLNAELDVQGSLSGDAGSNIPAALYDRTPVNYFGTTVRGGYVNQAATDILRISATQSTFGVTGRGTVAVIDTGVDPTHPVLAPVLLPGYDFTRDRDDADERSDINQSTAAVVDDVAPAWVNQSTAAVVDESTAAVVDTSEYSAFGHGTMVAGVVHLVAPRAWILPLKAFNADGRGYTSDVIRAVYRAVRDNAKVLNMSFSFSTTSMELSRAIAHANRNYVICVASVGNDGQEVAVYPAGYSTTVMGVASTTNADARSAFSNYGTPQVWVAAPGEGIVTTYPWGTYAATWGTSFSAPFVAGVAALLVDVTESVNESNAAEAVGHAKFISRELNKGRLDAYQAVAAWREAMGVR